MGSKRKLRVRKFLWPTTSLAIRRKLAKGNYTRLRAFEPLRRLSDRTILKLAQIIAKDLNRLRLDHSIQLHHFKSDKGRLGLDFEYEGKQASISDEELEKFRIYALFRIDHPTPYTSDQWKNFLNMIENIIKGRTFYEVTKRSYHRLSRTVNRISDVRGFTNFLLRLVDCINDGINPTKQPRRYKEEVFELASYLLKKFSLPNDTIYLTPEQIKGRITKNQPLVKK